MLIWGGIGTGELAAYEVNVALVQNNEGEIVDFRIGAGPSTGVGVGIGSYVEGTYTKFLLTGNMYSSESSFQNILEHPAAHETMQSMGLNKKQFQLLLQRMAEQA